MISLTEFQELAISVAGLIDERELLAVYEQMFGTQHPSEDRLVTEEDLLKIRWSQVSEVLLWCFRKPLLCLVKVVSDRYQVQKTELTIEEALSLKSDREFFSDSMIASREQGFLLHGRSPQKAFRQHGSVILLSEDGGEVKVAAQPGRFDMIA